MTAHLCRLIQVYAVLTCAISTKKSNDLAKIWFKIKTMKEKIVLPI